MRCPTLSELPPPAPGKTGWPWTEESPRQPDAMPDGRPWPRVSIVTPSYNQGQFIEGTIRSVLLQGYPNLEYIVIDGGSTDGSAEIIKKYEQWLAYWASEPDGGQSDAINKGFSRATGEILAWLNSDDRYEPCAVTEAVDVFLREPEVALVYGTWRCMDVTGRVIENAGNPSDFDPREAISNFLCLIPQPSAFFKRFAVKRIGMLDPRLSYCMDFDLWLRIGLTFPVRKVDRCWSINVVHDRIKSRSQANRLSADFLRCVDNIFSSSLLPHELAPLRRESATHAHLRAFWMCAAAKMWGCAAVELLRAFRTSPRACLTSPGAHRYYSFVLMTLLKNRQVLGVFRRLARLIKRVRSTDAVDVHRS